MPFVTFNIQSNGIVSCYQSYSQLGCDSRMQPLGKPEEIFYRLKFNQQCCVVNNVKALQKKEKTMFTLW